MCGLADSQMEIISESLIFKCRKCTLKYIIIYLIFILIVISLPHPRRSEIVFKELQANRQLIPPSALMHSLRTLLQEHRLTTTENRATDAHRLGSDPSGRRLLRPRLAGQADSEDGLLSGILGKVKYH